MGTICCHYPLTKDGNTSPYATSVVFPPPNSFRSYFFIAKFIGNANPPLLGFVTLAQGVKGRIQRWVGVKFLDIEGPSQFFFKFCFLMFQGPKWFQKIASFWFCHRETSSSFSSFLRQRLKLMNELHIPFQMNNFCSQQFSFFSWKNLKEWFQIFFIAKLFDVRSKNESFFSDKLF